jgi:hypothetical protein
VAAAVRLHGHVLGERHPRRELGLVPGDLPTLDEPAQDLGRRRGKEPRGDLGTGDLGEQLPGTTVRTKPGDRASYERRGQLHESRRRDLGHRGAHQQVDQAFFVSGLGRRVNEVHSPVVLAGQVAAQFVHGTLDGREGEPGGSEEPEHLRPGHRHDRDDRRDTVRHLPGHVREPHAVGLVE